jgi:hypothetical protein
MNKPFQMLPAPEPSHEWEEFFDYLIECIVGKAKDKPKPKVPERKRTADEYRYRCDSGHAL